MWHRSGYYARVTEQRTATSAVQGEVLDVDYDRDEIIVRLDGGVERAFAFQLFDAQDLYQTGQRFTLSFDEDGELLEVSLVDAPSGAHISLNGYVESVDPDDELVWVYLRDDEGWHRKVMPLQLFRDKDLDRPGAHFLLDVDEAGTPLDLHPDEAELEMQLQPAEEVKPRWTSRPAAEADPD